MAVEARITGTGSYAGTESALSDYSYTEDATPLNPADTGGGVGQFSFSAIENPSGRDGTVLLMGDSVQLVDGSNGTTTGIVSGVNSADGVASVSADSRLSLLLATRTMRPLNGTVAEAFRAYLALAGITTGIVVDPVYDTINAPTPGWTGVIWDSLKQLVMAYGGEVSLVSNNIVFRPLRGRMAVNKRNISEQWAIAKGQLARSVEVNYYNNRYAINSLAYPTGGWNSEVSVYQVDAGETLNVNVPISASLVSVVQPTCLSFVSKTNNSSVYSVIGADGLPIPPTQWLENGGRLTVSIGEDTKSLDLEIVGANSTQAPYRIAVASSASDTYSSLRIQGTGTFFDVQTVTLLTGIADEDTAQIIGVTVDSPHISTIEQAYTLGMVTAAQYGNAEQTLSISTVGINRVGDSGSEAYPTYDEFQSGVGGQAPVWTGKTYDQFQAVWNGKTYDEFGEYYLKLVQDDFENQAFGNVAGARVQYRDAIYRIGSATITPIDVSYTARADTTYDDLEAQWALTKYEKLGPDARINPYTYADFDIIMSGRTYNSFAMTPLWRTYAGYAADQPRP